MNNKAITLMELVVAMVLLGLVILGATAFDSASHSFFAESRRRADVVNDLNLVIEHIGKYAEQAVGNNDDRGILVVPPDSAPPGLSCPSGTCLFVRNDDGGPVWRKYEYDGTDTLTFESKAGTSPVETLTKNLIDFKVQIANSDPGPPDPEVNGIEITELTVRAIPADPSSTTASLDTDLPADGVQPEEYIRFYSFSHSTN